MRDSEIHPSAPKTCRSRLLLADRIRIQQRGKVGQPAMRFPRNPIRERKAPYARR
jgi:hypothetical protein